MGTRIRDVAPRAGVGQTHAQRLRSLRWLSAALAAVVVVLVSDCRPIGGSPTRHAGGATQARAAALSTRARVSISADLPQKRLGLGSAGRRNELLLAAANWYLTRMSLDEQIGQMLLDEADGLVYSPDMAIMIERQHIGGVMLFPDNLGPFVQTRALLQAMQAHAGIPLLIATDQEGGTISRIGQYFGYFPSPRQLGDSGDPQVAYAAGRKTALDLQQLGINTDLAPVVDVPVDGGGFWSPARTFSDDPQAVARFAGAFLSGLHSAGEIGCLKHFPGIGSVGSDPHQDLPVITRSLVQLRQTELYPYQALALEALEAPEMIMATDVLVPAVDPTYPAELSPRWIDGVLRGQIGYDGVVVTDSLWMKGISTRWSLPEAALLAVLAGGDLVLAAYNAASSQAVIDTFKAAIAAGRLTPARIEESARRLLLLKLRFGLLPIPPGVQY